MHTQAMLQRLKSRRFKAIFEYLDSARAGVVDLPLLASQESVMQSLDPAVRDDVARAAALVSAKVLIPFVDACQRSTCSWACCMFAPCMWFD